MKSKLKYLVILTLFSLFAKAGATHLVGGYMSYEYLGANSSGSSYRVTLNVYRDCSGSKPVPFDDQITVCAYYFDSKSVYDNFTFSLVSETKVDPPGSTTCPEATNTCLRLGKYVRTIVLPNSFAGYILKWERCCRNVQENLQDDVSGNPNQGQTYWCRVPATALKNSSPTFDKDPVPFFCLNDTVEIDNSAKDKDGDSLVYQFVTPWQGANTGSPNPTMCVDVMENPSNVDYKSGYSTAKPFGNNGFAKIDGQAGITTYHSKKAGRFAVAVEVLEYRKGVLISSIRLDLQLLVISCKPNTKPRLQFTGGQNVYIEAGQTFCTIINASDLDNGQVVTLSGKGDIITGTNGYTGTKATLTPAVNAGVQKASITFCWTPDCNAARTQPYSVYFNAVDNGCPGKFVNDLLNIYVTAFNPADRPTGPNTACQNAKNVQYRVSNSQSGNKYRWRIIGGVIADNDSLSGIVNVNWGNGTAGTVMLWVTSKYGCTKGPFTFAVSLKNAPAKPKISGNDTVCLNSFSNFTATFEPGSTLTWGVDGGNITGGQGTANITAYLTRMGNGFVTLVTSNAIGCSSPEDTFKVFVSHPVTPPLTGPRSICPYNKNIDYFVPNPTPNSTYKWTITGGTLASGDLSPAIRVNWGGKGIGTVEVQEVNKFGCLGDKVGLTVVKDHGLEGQLPKGDTSICEFTKGKIYTILKVNGETYDWIVTGGTIVSGQGTASIEVDWGIAGVGSVGVISTAWDSVNNLPCSSPVRARIVNIRPYPKPELISGLKELCQKTGEGAYFVSGDPASKYVWEVITNSFTGQGTRGINMNYNTFGTFKLRVQETTQYGCAGPWNEETVIIHPKPTSNAIVGQDVLCNPKYTNQNYSVTGFVNSKYNWWLDGGSITNGAGTNAVTVDWVGQQNSQIGVLETSEFGCVGDSIKLPVFIDNPSIVQDVVTVDPPPASDKNVLVNFTLLNAPRYNNQIIIQRRLRGSNAGFATVGTTNPTNSSYTDVSALTDSNSYEYRVAIVNLCGDSLYSNLHTDILLKGLKTGPFNYQLTFTNYLGFPIEKYELYRALENKTGYTYLKEYSGSTTSFPSTDLFSDGRLHYGMIFRLKAIEAAGGKGRESWSNDARLYFEPVIYIPNAFTPDENSKNDFFLPSASGLKTYSFKIYNRWGEKLFETDVPEKGWDGKFKGVPSPIGVYVYSITYTDYQDKVYTASGTIHLLK